MRVQFRRACSLVPAAAGVPPLCRRTAPFTMGPVTCGKNLRTLGQTFRVRHTGKKCLPSLLRTGWCVALLSLAGGCATIRTTDPQHTATEQFLLSSAAQSAVDQVSADTLRDRIVYIDTTYLTTAWQTAPELSFLTGQFRAKLLEGGARIAERREGAQIILELRSGGVGIDRLEF